MLRELAKLDPTYVPLTYPEVAERAWNVKQKGGKNRDSTKTEARPLYDKLIAAAVDERGRVLRFDQADDAWWERCLEKWRSEPTEGVDENGKRWKKNPRKTFANLRKYAVQIDRYGHRKGWKKDRNEFPLEDPKAREGYVFSEDDFRRCMDLASFRVQAALVFARYMGMRRTEILGLEVDRVKFETTSIKLEAEHTKTGSKTKRGREFGIAPEAMPFLVFLVAEAQAAGRRYLFPNRDGKGRLKDLKTPMRRLRRETGIPFRGLHDLRHTFITHKLGVEKVPPLDVAIYAGVSLEVMEKVYLHSKVEHTRHVVQAASVNDVRGSWLFAKLPGETVERARLIGAGSAKDVTPRALPPGDPDPSALGASILDADDQEISGKLENDDA